MTLQSEKRLIGIRQVDIERGSYFKVKSTTGVDRIINFKNGVV